MRVFFSTGEASGELQAALAAQAMRNAQPGIRFEGIGGERLRSAGFTIVWDTRGWASMGPLQALGKIPKLLAIMWLTVARLRASPPDLVVLVDFGAFNLRLAQSLRRTGYRGPIVYYFPPGAWLDKAAQAAAVAAAAQPLTPFAHQRDFYRGCGLPIAYFGHPLASTIAPRPARPAPPPDGGTLALLPGSRRAELARHGPLMFATAQALRRERPALEVIIAAADEEAAMTLRAQRSESGVEAVIVSGAAAALREADAACIASGTAVLEAALAGVPTVATYVLSAAQARIARRVYHGRWITLPNLIAGKAIVPERLQEDATVEHLRADLATLLADPAPQLAEFAALRAQLGPPDALERIAAHLLAAGQ